MAFKKSEYRSGPLLMATTNGVKAISEVTKKIREEANKFDLLALRISELLVNEMRINLQYNIGNANMENSHYNVDRLLDNIKVHKYRNNSYRVAIEENEDKPIMYLLEFGTGIVGENNQTPEASAFGWKYLIGEHIRKRTRTDKNGKLQKDAYWVYKDEKTGEFRTTRGLYPVAYIYDAMQEETINKIIEEARREVGI